MAFPNLTLYFLQASRSIRIAWLLEELGLPYTSIFFPRENNKAPTDFKQISGNALGKAPVLKDGNLVLTESGAITEYLIETYDSSQRLLGGTSPVMRAAIRSWIHAAEGTFMIHALAVTYARWFSSDSSQTNGDLQKLEEGLYINVRKDLDWLDGELKGKSFLVGEGVTAADTMCLMSVQFIFARGLAGEGKERDWGHIHRWIDCCEKTETWKRAVEKTGHEL